VEQESQQPREHRDLSGRRGVDSSYPPKTGVLLFERRGSGKGIVDCAGDWSHLIQIKKKITSSFTKIKDIHPGFENRDYILH
jgi:hypothetical protein